MGAEKRETKFKAEAELEGALKSVLGGSLREEVRGGLKKRS